MTESCRFVLAFAAAACVALSSTAAEVELSTGEVLKGEVVSQNDESVTLKHPILGPLTIKRGTIAAVRGVEPAAEDTKPAPKPEPAPTVKPGSFWLTLLEGWESQFVVSFSGSAGNSENANIRLAFLTKRITTQADRIFKQHFISIPRKYAPQHYPAAHTS